MPDPGRFIFEFSPEDVKALKVSADPDAALRLVKGDEDAFVLLGNAEGFSALARACALLAQPEAGKRGAALRVDGLSPAGAEGLEFHLRRDDRVSDWPDRSAGTHRRVTDILANQDLVRMDDAYALLLKSVGKRPLAVYTVLKSKLGMPADEVVRIGDNAPLVIKTYRDLTSAQADAEEIDRAGGIALPAYFGKASADDRA